MQLQFTDYTIPLGIILLFLTLGVFYVFIYRKGPQDIIGIAVLVFSIIWISALLLEKSSESHILKFLFNKIQYTGSVLLPVGIFLLTAQYTGFKKFVTLKSIIYFSIFPVITLFLVFTNEFHNLIWTDAKIIIFNSSTMIIKDYNIIYFIYTAYLYILIITGIIIIIMSFAKSFKKSNRKSGWKNLLLIPYISIPLIMAIIKKLGFNPFPNLEEVPIVLSIGTLVVIAILNRTKIREIMPMAFKTVFEKMKDGLILLDRKDNVIKMNPTSQNIFDTPIDEVSGKPIEDLIISSNGSSEEKMDLMANKIADKNGLLTVTESSSGVDGQHYYDTIHSDIKNNRGKYMGKVIVLRDITNIKKAEEDIKYLSFHDKLTRLYNRAFFDFELKRLNTARQFPLSLVIGDVNGLKLINDAFGHPCGDKLLIKIADILKECFRDEDIVARWGGDEFSVILPQTSMDEAINIIDRVYKKCKESSTDILPLSISLGAATKVSASQNIKEVIKEAEDNMYRHKLVENQSARSSMITSLKKALEERDYETEKHTSRMKKIAIMFGEALKLPDSKLDDLSLLASLHDIGKIAIPDNIVLKPGKLSNEEWKTMRKHSEIGYRIAQSTAELAPIAKGILHHHERWDGTGYPYGLSKDKIPLISKIISIVDTYDAITSERPYKIALSKELSLEEIKRCSCSQFDQKLVDVFVDVIEEYNSVSIGTDTGLKTIA
jgi:diguanylate cyclase (GGDEF)-like protein/PAS domain S-box-containing protein